MAFDRTAELGAMRADMLRFARLQLRDPSLAEDAVQEAQLAALAGSEKFSNRSSYKTWVFSILRNKLVDIIRARAREVPFCDLADGDDEYPNFEDEAFDASGHWLPGNAPGDWGDPSDALEQARFWMVFEICLNDLPEKTGRVFMMREILGLETGEICKELGLTATNCWVVLHRARLGLRECLDQKWFARKST